MKLGVQINTWVFGNNFKDSGITVVKTITFPSFVAFSTHGSNSYKHRLAVNWIVPTIIGRVDADFYGILFIAWVP